MSAADKSMVPQRPPPTYSFTSAVMRANSGKNTSPELRVRALLRKAGYPGYRLHWKAASGTPDIAYPGRRIAIFVNGCYWHQCPSCKPRPPKSNARFWLSKFEDTASRDQRNQAALLAEGWRVFVIWECELRNPETTQRRIGEIEAVLRETPCAPS
ncbi:MAG: very short patch repair endonuclease [Fimbriimonadaceae bacterium]|nr:very short patch repair endonuclease [Fimbriimonadaceae bacterium]